MLISIVICNCVSSGVSNLSLCKIVRFKRNKTFNKRKNRALLTLKRSQKHYEIFNNNVLRKNIPRKQLRLETIEIV